MLTTYDSIHAYNLGQLKLKQVFFCIQYKILQNEPT